MNTKPKDGQTVAYKVAQVWRGIYSVKWTDALNYPRSFKTLFRRVNGQWTSGEAHPCGVHGDSLRLAHPVIAVALDKATHQKY